LVLFFKKEPLPSASLLFDETMNHRIPGISEIGFGCGGNAGLMTRGTPKHQTETIARALDLGITYFDNAPDYGNGLAEENLGRALKQLGAKPFLTSKVEIRAENLADVAAHVIRSAEASLSRLGVDALDLLQIHNGPVATPPRLEGAAYRTLGLDHYEQAIEALNTLKAQGKIKHTGFVIRGGDATEATNLLATRQFTLINVPYTLLNPTAARGERGLTIVKDFGGIIDIARDYDTGVAVYSALAGGVLTDAGIAGAPRHPLARAADPRETRAELKRQQAARLSFLARETGTTMAQAAYRFVLSHPGVTTVIGGFSAIDQLEELAAMSGAGPFPPDLMARLREVWQTDFIAA
jgi:L-glyceraldehyde 3-phosphate reductase